MYKFHFLQKEKEEKNGMLTPYGKVSGAPVDDNGHPSLTGFCWI
jgi:hypothetical protein